MSDAVTTSGLAGGQRISRERHTTERNYGSESDNCFMRQETLLLRLKQKNSCEHKTNAGQPLIVAGPMDTFAC